jgi:hypothetical protein
MSCRRYVRGWMLGHMGVTRQGGRSAYVKALVITFAVPWVLCVLAIVGADTTTPDNTGCSGALVSKPSGIMAAAVSLLVLFACACAMIALRRRWRWRGRPNAFLVGLTCLGLGAAAVAASIGVYLAVVASTVPFCIPW